MPDNPAVIRLGSADGISELEICQMCAEFFDKSADFLQSRKIGDEE